MRVPKPHATNSERNAMADAKKDAISEDVNALQAAASASEIEAQLEQLKRDIAGLTQALADFGSAKLNQAADKASELKENVSEASSEAISGMRSGLEQVQSDVENHIRAKPLQSVAIAAGLGFLFALFSRR